MAKWADYVIVEVRKDEGIIDKVKAFRDFGNELKDKKIFSKEQIIKKIEGGYSFCTATKNQNGKYQRGEDVHVVEVDGEKYIRTDRNDKPADNLGNLPEF